jgi:hypothetical protein
MNANVYMLVYMKVYDYLFICVYRLNSGVITT